MTGEKNRYSTTEKLWKLDDETLETPRHDEMVLYLLDKKNIVALFPEIISFEEEIVHRTYLEDRYYHGLQRIKYLWGCIGNEEFWKHIINKNYEYEEVGYDRAYWREAIDEYHSIKLGAREVEIRSETPITANKNFIVGYWDVTIMLNDPSYHGDYFKRMWEGYGKYPKGYYIEVKPRINSFGATLRQLRTYQQYEEASIDNTYLFTGDLRFKEAFEKQGIKIISPQKTIT